MKKIVVLGILLALVVGLAACGGDDGSEKTSSISASASTLTSSQLAIGTLMLEETENAVTVEQAGELLPVWQMLQALQSSGTAAPAEIEAVLGQIQRAMTDEQLAAIKGIELTSDRMLEMLQERGGMKAAAGRIGGGQREGGFQLPAGVSPGGGGGLGGGGIGGGPGSEEMEAMIAQRLESTMTGMLVSLLEARAEGQEWQAAAPNQEMILQNTLFEALVQATGLEQQDIRAQTRAGKTLQELAEANGADVEQILVQVIAAETERAKQAIVDGSLDQAEGDQYLANLETLVQEMLQGAWQFGGRGGDGSGRP